MKKIIAFAGSNSKTSINKKLAVLASTLVSEVKVTVLDLNDFEVPIYSIDLENENGIPDNAQKFINHIKSTDGIILSLAEHNGAYTTAFKNMFDWMSRIDNKTWNDKPMLLMATSPGARGGATVLEIAKGRFPYMGGQIVADFSLPSFQQNYSDDGILDATLNKEFKIALSKFENALK